MPNKASAIKRVRQDAKRRIQNRSLKASMRTAVKKARAAAVPGAEAQAVLGAVAQAQSKVARAAKRCIHPRKAARLTSRLMKKANKATKPAAQA